jgi:hypothetical protein
MDRLKVSVIFLTLSFLSFACASTKQVEKIPPFKFVGTTLSKGVEDKGEIGIPLEPTDKFTTEDSEVIALVKFENLSGKHTLRWEWYNPTGNLYYSTENFPLETSHGKYLTEATALHRLSLQGRPAVSHTGNWEVKIFLDDVHRDSKPFFLKATGIDLPDDVSRKPYPKDWGLVIGIEDYLRLPNVEYARKDALIVKDYFIKVLGVPEENIMTLIDSDATKGRIEGYLREYIPSNVGKDTTLYVYFAGHGAPGMETEKGVPYLVPYDGDINIIEYTCYKLTSFYEDLDKLDIRRVYVFLDSCFSGFAARAADEMLKKGARPTLFHVKDVDPRSDSLIALSATSGGQVSNIYPEKKHGLFTYYLMRALKGEADTDDDSWVSMKEIFTYVKSHVTRVSRRMNMEQMPVILPSLDKLKDVAVNRVPE